MRFVAILLQLLAQLPIPPSSPRRSLGVPTPAEDTVFVRISGPPGTVHRLVEELRIAPGAEDTTLFTEVSDFEVDLAGRLWVFDPQCKCILLFDRAGKFLRRVGREGAGPGEFRYNSGMVSLKDTGIAVWDAQNWRISFFSSKGDFRTSWVTPSGFSTNDGLVTDRSGALFLKHPIAPPQGDDIIGRMGLVRVRGNGTVGDSLVPPDLPVARVSYVARNKNGQTLMNPPFAPDYLWDWHPAGYFVVAHGGNYEIVLARPGSRPLAIRREGPRVPVSGEERAEQRDLILWNMRRMDPGWSWTGPGIPESKAPLSGLRISRDGRIWAQVAQPSERIPADELVVPRDKSRPLSHFRTALAYELFTPEGRFLGRVNFPPRSRLMEAEGNSVWALLRDSDGLPAVVRFRIEPGLR